MVHDLLAVPAAVPQASAAKAVYDEHQIAQQALQELQLWLYMLQAAFNFDDSCQAAEPADGRLQEHWYGSSHESTVPQA